MIRSTVDSYVGQLNEERFSGVVLVAKDFVPFTSRALGYSDRSRGQPNATITPFNISTVTMLFTAAAIGRLVDDGRVGLDDPLTKYVPSYPKPVGDQITVAMLLAHTAGTGDYLSDPGYARVRDGFDSLPELLGAVNTRVPAGTVPGKERKFSTTGYLLLGAVVEKASGRDYYTYVADEVFYKAGIASGFLPNSDASRKDRGFALGYKGDGGTNWSTLPARGTPATGAYASAVELLSFHRALATGALLKPDTAKRVGLASGTFTGEEIGASAVFTMSQSGYTVVVLSNAGATAPVADAILKIVGAR